MQRLTLNREENVVDADQTLLAEKLEDAEKESYVDTNIITG